MNSTQPNIALSDCRIWRPAEFNGRIEIVLAAPAVRKFPTRVNDTLGICLKIGPSHSVTCDGRSIIYPANAICIRYPGTVWSCETSNAGFISADLDPELLPQKVEHKPMRLFSSSELPVSANMILNLANGADPLQKDETYAEMIAALSNCGALDSEVLYTDRNASHLLLHAREFMIAHSDQLLTLDEIAKAANANKYVLVRHFKRKLGITPHQFLLGVRVEKVRLLLTQGATAAEAAAAAGFTDQSHLNRHFRRIVGMTTHQYAKQIRKSIAVSTPNQSILY